MSTVQEQNKAISRRWREEADKGNWGIVEELVSPNFVMHMPGSPPINREGALQFFKIFYDAFPDMHHTFDDFVAEGDKVALRFTVNGTHKGDFQGIPPTGKTVKISGSVVDRIVDGKIVEHWSLMDTMGMMQQLGVIPAPEQSGS
jgi:steroid delta-isomerase-like uncharacterized protein